MLDCELPQSVWTVAYFTNPKGGFYALKTPNGWRSVLTGRIHHDQRLIDLSDSVDVIALPVAVRDVA